MNKIPMFAFFMCLSQLAVAESIWCKTLGVGCYTLQDKVEAKERCRLRGVESYQEALAKALADPSIWGLDGADSATDYARMRESLTVQICTKGAAALRE